MVQNRKNYSLFFPEEISFCKIVDPEQYEKYTYSRDDIRSRLNTADLLTVGYGRKCAQSEGIPISRYQMMEQLTTISPTTAIVVMSFD